MCQYLLNTLSKNNKFPTNLFFSTDISDATTEQVNYIVD